MLRKFTIGEIGLIFNLSKDTLRYYDDIGLIKPWEIGENGYRYYVNMQFDIISTIVLMRNAGMPIKEIMQLIENNNVREIESKIYERKRIVEKRINELKKTMRRLEIIQGNIHSITSNTGITEEFIPEFWLLSTEIQLLDDLNIGELAPLADPHVIEWISYSTVMSTIPGEKLLQGRFRDFNRFGYVSEQPLHYRDQNVIKIENQLFVCSNTSVLSTEFEEIDSVYRNMLDYIENKNLEVAGEAIERNMLELYHEEKKVFTHFFKIYIPVRKL
jgi:DNA-binding transcriptional MerR regulator/effector-binding domain-containing protein